jgi:hypothetical protein
VGCSRPASVHTCAVVGEGTCTLTQEDFQRGFSADFLAMKGYELA